MNVIVRLTRPIRPGTGLRVAGLVLWIVAAAAPAFAQEAKPMPAAAVLPVAALQQSRYEAAQLHYENGHYALAFAAFAQLADEGHCDSARISQQMVRHGRSLYGIEFGATPARLALWRGLPACPAMAVVR